MAMVHRRRRPPRHPPLFSVSRRRCRHPQQRRHPTPHWTVSGNKQPSHPPPVVVVATGKRAMAVRSSRTGAAVAVPVPMALANRCAKPSAAPTRGHGRTCCVRKCCPRRCRMSPQSLPRCVTSVRCVLQSVPRNAAAHGKGARKSAKSARAKRAKTTARVVVRMMRPSASRRKMKQRSATRKGKGATRCMGQAAMCSARWACARML